MPRTVHTNGVTRTNGATPSQTTDRPGPAEAAWEPFGAPATSPKRPRIPRHLARNLTVGAGCLVVTAAVTAALQLLWPEVAPLIAVAFGAVFFAGLVLWWDNRTDTAAKSTLGAALLAGTLVTIAVFGIQADLDAQRQLAAEQQALRLTLGLQQDLSGIDLSGQDLTSFYLRGKDLTQAVLAGADLTLVNLTGAELAEADLKEADLGRAQLAGAKLSAADLSDADLSTADMFGADLSHALLPGADLTDGFMAGADLSNALLAGADLSGADLSGADLAGAILDGATVDDDTQWPVGYDWHDAGVTRQR